VSDRRAACPEIGSAYAVVSQTVARSPVDRSNRLLVQWRHVGRGAPLKQLIGARVGCRSWSSQRD